MKLLYKAQIIEEDTDEILARVSSYSLEGLEEEMGKRKFEVRTTPSNPSKDWCFTEE